jgi:hypothetical protein
MDDLSLSGIEISVLFWVGDADRKHALQSREGGALGELILLRLVKVNRNLSVSLTKNGLQWLRKAHLHD